MIYRVLSFRASKAKIWVNGGEFCITLHRLLSVDKRKCMDHCNKKKVLDFHQMFDQRDFNKTVGVSNKI